MYIKFCLVFFLSKHAKQLLFVTFFDTPTGVGASQSFVTQAEGQTPQIKRTNRLNLT